MNPYVDKILKEKKITSFLEERGIFPARTSADKLFYVCPIHQGDNTPSFVVYPAEIDGRGYQTYHCFGCHSGINLINLKSDLDNISLKKSVGFFLKDINVESEEVTDSIIENILKDDKELENQKEIENILLTINSICKDHLLTYNDEEEICFFDSFFKEVDRVAMSNDVDTLNGILEILIDKEGLTKRVENFEKRQEDEEMSYMNWRV